MFATWFRRDDRCDYGRSSDHGARREIDRRCLATRRAADLSLELTVAGFPNMFMVTGPGSPSVLIEHGRVDRAARRLGRRPPDRDARGGVHRHRGDRSAAQARPLGPPYGRLFGAHAAPVGQHLVHGGKRAGQGAGRDVPYTGGVGPYRAICDEVAEPRHAGLPALRSGPFDRLRAGLRADAMATTARSFAACSPTCAAGAGTPMLADLNLPPFVRSAPRARATSSSSFWCARPAGRPVGEVLDGTLVGADGPLPYRLLSAADAGSSSDCGLLSWRRLGPR